MTACVGVMAMQTLFVQTVFAQEKHVLSAGVVSEQESPSSVQCSRLSVEYLDSIPVPKDVTTIVVADELPYALFGSGDVSVWTGKHPLQLVSLETGEVIWKKGYKPSAAVAFVDDGLMIDELTAVKIYDYATGKEKRKIQARYAWHDNEKDILIGFTKGKRLSGFRLSTGEKLWDAKTNHEDETRWRVMEWPDSTHIVYLSDVAGKIDITTGENYTHELKRRINDNKGNALGIGLGVLGVLGMALGGLSYIPAIGMSHYEYLGSNIVGDGVGNYYVADRDNLMCLDDKMEEKWKIFLPHKTGSRSRLYLRGDRLDIINEGTGWLNGNYVKVGSPFWGSFDKDSGENEYLHMLPTEWDKGVFGKDYIIFMPTPLYYFNVAKEQFTKVDHRPDVYPALTRGEEVVMVDKDLNYGDVWWLSNLYSEYKKEPDGTIIKPLSGKPEYVKIDEDGNVVEAWDTVISYMCRPRQGTFVIKDGYLYTPPQSGRFRYM